MGVAVAIFTGLVSGLLTNGLWEFIRFKLNLKKNKSSQPIHNSFLFFYYNPNYIELTASNAIDHEEVKRTLNRKRLFIFSMFCLTCFGFPLILKFLLYQTLLLTGGTGGGLISPLSGITEISDHVSWQIFNFLEAFYNLNATTTLTSGQAAQYSSTMTLLFILPTAILSHYISRIVVFVMDKFKKQSFKSYFNYKLLCYLGLTFLEVAAVVSMTTTLSYLESLGAIIILLIIGFGFASSNDKS